MTDAEQLFTYRMEQATATLNDAKKMFDGDVGPRSVVNRCYYAMFYATLALFLKTGIVTTTSKHSGIIGLFDVEFIITGKMDKKYSKMLHRLFDKRQEFDYKEFTVVTAADGRDAIEAADDFVRNVQEYINSVVENLS